MPPTPLSGPPPEFRVLGVKVHALQTAEAVRVPRPQPHRDLLCAPRSNERATAGAITARCRMQESA